MIAISLGCALYYCSNRYKRLRTRTGTLRYCELNFTSYGASAKQFAGIICNSFTAVSTSTSLIKIGVAIRRYCP